MSSRYPAEFKQKAVELVTVEDGCLNPENSSRLIN